MTVITRVLSNLAPERNVNVAVLVSILMCLSLNAAFAENVLVSVPSTAAYSYWIKSPSGTVTLLPTTVSGHKSFSLPKGDAGQVLTVIDTQSGRTATRTLQRESNGKLVPIVLSPSDFIGATPATAPVVAAPETKKPSDDATPDRNSPWRIVGLIFSLGLGGGVVWVIVKIVNSKGKPLIDAARRAGIDVPDPSEPEPDPQPFVPVQKAQNRPVEAMPETAGTVPKVRSATSPHAPLAVAQLVGVQGLAGGSVFTLADQVVTIGREGSNTIVLAENAVSRQHAKIERDADGHTNICDLGSANGVVINGLRVRDALLNDGDEIKIGDSLFRFEK